eukprot:260573_1
MRSSETNENTSLKHNNNQRYDSIEHSEGLTPDGTSAYEIVNPAQLFMLACWATLGIIPNIAALIVGFERDDLECNRMNDYGFIHPSAYLKLTGIVGIFTCLIFTFGLLHWMRHDDDKTMERIINGKLFEFPNKNIICKKIIVMILILISFIWCIIGWIIVSKLNFNGCSNELITQTILGWTIVQIILMTCAISSRLVRRRKVTDSLENQNEEGTVDK